MIIIDVNSTPAYVNAAIEIHMSKTDGPFWLDRPALTENYEFIIHDYCMDLGWCREGDEVRFIVL